MRHRISWLALGASLVALAGCQTWRQVEKAVDEVEAEGRAEAREMARRLEEAGEEVLAKPSTPAVLPFDVKLELVEIPGAPGLHSNAAAVAADGKWLLLGGRTNGMHNITPESFPTSERNTDVWVVDPQAGSVCSAPLDGLPQNLYDALSSTNQQSIQARVEDPGGESRDVLWIVGGYGFSANFQDDVTFGYLTAVDVDGLIAAVLDHCGRQIPAIESYFSYGSFGDGCEIFSKKNAGGNCDLTVTGGGLQSIGDELYLAFGQRFGGKYNAILTQKQLYACQVVKFDVQDFELDWGATFTIDAADVHRVGQGGEKCPPAGELKPNSDPYHRRDLNVVPAIYAGSDGPQQAIFTYGGVFKDDFFGFTEPIHITAEGVTVNTDVHQKMLQYESAAVSLYDPAADVMHTMLLGGISANYCTAGEQGVETPQCTETTEAPVFPPFVADGTILSCQGGGASAGAGCDGFSQAFLYRPYAVHNPGLPNSMFGANARFLKLPEVAAYGNGVLRFEQLPAGEYTQVGYVFGGIEVDGEPPGHPWFADTTRSRTRASDRVFSVLVKPLP